MRGMKRCYFKRGRPLRKTHLAGNFMEPLTIAGEFSLLCDWNSIDVYTKVV